MPGCGSHRQALSARPRLAYDGRPARHPAPGPGRCCYRRVQRVLLASDPGRESTPATIVKPRVGQRFAISPDSAEDRDVEVAVHAGAGARRVVGLDESTSGVEV